MYSVILEKRVIKFIQALPPKHRDQLKKSILCFRQEPRPHDSEHLKNYEPYRRSDFGEYRIVYRIEEDAKQVYVLLVGKRNGGEIYRQLKRI